MLGGFEWCRKTEGRRCIFEYFQIDFFRMLSVSARRSHLLLKANFCEEETFFCIVGTLEKKMFLQTHIL